MLQKLMAGTTTHRRRWIAAFSYLSALSNVSIAAGYSLFPGPNSIPSSVPEACRTALSVNISCPILFSAAFVSNVRPINASVLDQACTSECTTSLSSYFQQAVESCGDTAYELYGEYGTNDTYTVSQIVSPFLWSHRVTCLSDGQSYCYADISNGDFITASNQGQTAATNAKKRAATSKKSTTVAKTTTIQSKTPTATTSTSKAVSPTTQSHSTTAGRNASSSVSAQGLAATSPATTGMAAIGACSQCLFLWEQAMLDSPYGSPRINTQIFSSQLSACSIPASSYPYQTTSSTSTSSAPTSSSTPYVPSCIGTNYTVEAGDTCASIAEANSVAYGRFIVENNLDLNCTLLSPGQTVCIGPPCALLTVQNGTTCDAIVNAQSFYLTQFLSWNPTIWSNCENLESMVGETVCVSPPGTTSWYAPPTNYTSMSATYVVPSTSFGTLPSQTGFPNSTMVPYVNTTFNAVTTVTAPPGNTTVSSIYATLTANCPFNATYIGIGLTIYVTVGNCSELLQPYCDPMINQTAAPSTTFPSSCLPAYYMATGSASGNGTGESAGGAPTQNGIASNCDRFYVVQTGDTCSGIVADYDGEFSLSQFYGWNPAVGSTCEGLYAGYAVCVGVPGTPTTAPTGVTTTTAPVQTGIASNCDRYYLVESGDTCQSIVNVYEGEFTLQQFYSWNPAVGSGCQDLFAGYDVCVGVPGTPTKPPTTTPAKPTSTMPPTQSGIASNCDRYYTVKSGDTCQAIVNDYNGEFTLQQFYGWNPAVGSSCQGLQAGYDVCVGVPGTPTTGTPSPTGPSPQEPSTDPNCKTYYKVVSGNTCSQIETKFKITAAQFNAWNPYVGSTCKNLLVSCDGPTSRCTVR